MSINKKCVIIIPIYKKFEDLSMTEKTSFIRVCEILSLWDIVIVSYRDLMLDSYIGEAKKYNVNISIEYFKKEYFSSIIGYNDLMLSVHFYKRFKSYRYMLIYQLDAYVFRDELDQWIEKGYDYVGAPWFYNFKSNEEGEKLWAVGNGGLSLRKISYFIKLLSYKGPLFIYVDISHGFYAFVKSIIKFLGFHNTLFWWKKFKRLRLNEDSFLMIDLKNICNIKSLFPNTPLPEDAIGFSFEKSPSYLFGLNGNQLPFGCHAWEKYEYDEFWSKYIKM